MDRLGICTGVVFPLRIVILCRPVVVCNWEVVLKREESEKECPQAIIWEQEGRAIGMAREDWLQGK